MVIYKFHKQKSYIAAFLKLLTSNRLAKILIQHWQQSKVEFLFKNNSNLKRQPIWNVCFLTDTTSQKHEAFPAWKFWSQPHEWQQSGQLASQIWPRGRLVFTLTTK